jgi:hypothetical protein
MFEFVLRDTKKSLANFLRLLLDEWMSLRRMEMKDVGLPATIPNQDYISRISD